MDEVVNIIVSLFEFLTNTQIFGVGLIWWVTAPTLIGLAISLIARKGKEENDE